MSGSRVFVDTNVFAYALDGGDPVKQASAQKLIDGRRQDIVVSTQVLIELYAVCTRKLGMPSDRASAAVEAISGFPVMDADRELVLRALALSVRAQLSIFDAAIVCAAQRAGASELLTEDLNAGQRFGELVVVDPFEISL